MKISRIVPGHDRPCKTTADRRSYKIVGLLAAIGFANATLDTLRAADFYAGKTITISTYGAPGDSYDVYMRLLPAILAATSLAIRASSRSTRPAPVALSRSTMPRIARRKTVPSSPSPARAC